MPIVKPTVAITTITDITKTSATSGGNVTNAGNGSVTARGVCWSTTQNPTIANSHTTNGLGTGTFVSYLTNLTANTTYFVRAYATNEAGTAYDNQVSFTTLPNEMPSVTTTAATNISSTAAVCGGNVTSDGGTTVTERGVCYSSSPSPTLANSHTSNGTGLGSYISNLTALTVNTLYYFRAYATNNIGTTYGNQLSFTTLSLPIVTTTPATNITQNSATTGGNVTSEGGTTVTARGVCWGTSSNPSISGNHTTNGTGLGSFVSNLTGLIGNTLYHIRAYATNSVGTSYGTDLTFTTLTLPSVTTAIVTNITAFASTGGGTVTSDGGAAVTSRGVCWNTSANPSITNNHTTDGSGIGSFISNLINLVPNTLYYVRAYATNSVGTAYGNQVTFTTLTWTFTIGQNYGGGIIFYIDGTTQHGLIAATSDQSTSAGWGCFNTLIGGTSTSIGAGQSNTTVIVNGCTTAGIAARICYDLILNGYNDWFLPSKDEMNQMYLQKNIIGGFVNNDYWSSSEVSAWAAWCQNFGTGVQTNNLGKANTRWVRAIRSF